jgi:hypothetical protein
MTMGILVILLVIALVIVWGPRRENARAADEIALLRSRSRDLSGRVYQEAQLDGLPEPVQRYFRNVLKEGQPYVSAVSLTHNGQFKTGVDKEWINIEGQQLFIVDEPGFLWRGKTSLFSVRDMYVAGEGRIVVSLFSLFNVVDGRGEKYDQGELLRWLGESVWFPTNLLPNERLRWEAVDESTARMLFHYRSLALEYTVTFNDAGEITEMATQRYMGDERLETWVGRVSDYREVGGMRIPMTIEALWDLEEGEHTYARFNVQSIRHE